MVTRSLASVLREKGAPRVMDYLSLDTEGSEFAILSTFPFGEYAFRLMTIEHNFQVQQVRRSRRHSSISHERTAPSPLPPYRDDSVYATLG